jgi:3-isopropylmalate/(R)-2-methylmalate dehydratase small subunit
MSRGDPFLAHTGVAAPLLVPNVDTDAIVPSREMKHVSRRGLGQALFAGWRYHHEGARRLGPNADFVLNRPQYQGATILLGGDNFGCGSSREQAVWSLVDFGIRVLVAPSFGAIFRGNCLRNGVLPVELKAADVETLAAWVALDPQVHRITVDLQACELRGPPRFTRPFRIEPAARERLLAGRDEIDEALQHVADFDAWQARDRLVRPWLYRGDEP